MKAAFINSRWQNVLVRLTANSNGLREGARYYLIGASFWELDWEQTLFYFDQVRAWGNLWDGTMTASERYWFASMRYADQLVGEGQFCDADAYYQSAQAIAPLDSQAAEGYELAHLACFPPTEAVTATPTATSTPATPYP